MRTWRENDGVWRVQLGDDLPITTATTTERELLDHIESLVEQNYNLDQCRSHELGAKNREIRDLHDRIDQLQQAITRLSRVIAEKLHVE